MDCLQNWQDGTNLLHTLTESGTLVLSASVVPILVTDGSGVLGLLVFMGMYPALFDCLALILPGALFFGLVCVTGGQRMDRIVTIITP